MSFEKLEALDSHASLRNALRVMADMKEEWAGIPLPITGQPLVIEPTYPKAAELAAIGQTEEPFVWPPGYQLRNVFWSSHRRSDIIVWSQNDKVQWGLQPRTHHFDQDLQTLGASIAWGIEQEANALALLAEHLKHHPFKQYLLTGMFIESSPRSGVSYVFRKLRPTIAVTMRGPQLRILCALCMHPIAYYAGSWAGAMCPTDDVIAHLLLMRADEPMFWRRCNQHPAHLPEAGL